MAVEINAGNELECAETILMVKLDRLRGIGKSTIYRMAGVDVAKHNRTGG